MKRFLSAVAGLALFASQAFAQVGGGVANVGGQPAFGAFGAPAYASGCGGSATFGPGSNNVFGSITFGGTATSCVINWGPARLAVPFCTVTNATTGSAVAIGGVATATNLTVTALSTLVATVTYFCPGI